MNEVSEGRAAEVGRVAERESASSLLESFYRSSRFLSSILNIDDLLRAILEDALRAVTATRGFVGLVNRATGALDLRITAGQGWTEQPVRSIQITDEPGSGITACVAATGVPYVTGDVRRDPHYWMFFPDVRSEIAVPLVNRDGRVTGVINIESEEVDAFGERDLQLLLALANQASIALSLANQRARETALIEIGNELAGSTDVDSLLLHVVRRSADLLRADDCSIFQLDPESGRLVLRASSHLLAGRVGELAYKLGEGLTGWVAEKATPVRLDDVRTDSRWRGLYPELPPEAVEAYLSVPVFMRTELWGVLRVLRRTPANAKVRNNFTERDEALLTTLARQVGAALSQQALLQKTVQMERMAAWGEMSARSAHMIGNKVFALKGQLNELEYLAAQPDFSRQNVLDVVTRAKQSVFRLEEILAEFRDFLMATHLARKPTDFNELVDAIVRDTFPRGGAVQVSVELTPGLPQVSVDAKKIRRAVSELLENSVHHQPEGGEILVRTGPWSAAERERWPQVPFASPWVMEASPTPAAVRIDVIDRGPGIPPENKTRLFQPFFTTRAKGMGLGLSIVKGIIDAHQGAIAEVGRQGEGAHFIIVLPALRTE